MEDFKRSTPESVGIASRTILDFLDYTEHNGIELHSLAVYRHGSVCAEGAFAPYHSNTPHLLYSATKSVVAIAIGFAVQEGFLRMDERITEVFAKEMGEYRCSSNPNMLEVTIEHLLTMSCGQEKEIFPYQDNWIQAFLQQDTPRKPGTFFMYNTPGVNLLVAALRKKTGKNLVEFLRPRLFDPLGMSRFIHCDALRDGTEIGGGGLYWTTDDFMRFALFLLQKGEWEGKQLLDRAWFEKAVTKQVETPGGHDKYGYGYLIWMGQTRGSYQCCGMLGQYAVLLPEQDAFLVTTANCSLFPEASDHADHLLDALHSILAAGMQQEKLPENKEEQAVLQYRLQHLALPALHYAYSDLQKTLPGRRFRCDRAVGTDCFLGYNLANTSPLHRLPFTELEFQNAGRNLVLRLRAEDEVAITLGMQGRFQCTELYGESVCACARWRERSCLEVEIRLLESIQGMRFLFRFGKEGTVLEIKADPLLMFDFSMGDVDNSAWTFHQIDRKEKTGI